MKILFITSTRIGDAVLSTSVLNYIIKTYPWSSIYLATGEDPSLLFQDFQNVKKIYILKKKRFKFHWLKLWYQTIFIKWDVVIDLRGSIISHLLYAKKKYIYKSNNKYLHILDDFSSLLKIKKINYPVISINKNNLFKAEEHCLKFKNTIAIGASANWPAKVWPAKKFAKLIKLLLKNSNFGKNATIIFFGSSKDIKDTKKIINLLKKKKNIKNLCGKLNLLEVYAYIKQCKIFIGNDSGLMHIAAASGICTLGLFGPSLETRYAPKGKKAYFIRTKESYKSLTGKKNFDWNTKKNLMNSLSVTNVNKKIRKILK